MEQGKNYTELVEKRKEIKEEFTFYLTHVAKSARRTEKGYNLQPTAVQSFLSFLDVNRLFDYNPEKWKDIECIYDITDPDELSRIVNALLDDSDFIQLDNDKNQGWRSGSIMHYACFINARAYFLKKIEKSLQAHAEQVFNSKLSSSPSSLQQIFYGAPGTGKSHTINEETAGEDVIRTTFHPDTDYSTFVGAYKPTTLEETVMTVIGTKAVPVENADGTLRTESKIVYEFVAQAFLQAYVEAWKKYAQAEGEPKKQYLVIEEINRGNCAQIFGDLFQLLDRNDSGFSDYPIQADTDMKRQLQKAFSGLELPNKETLNHLYKGRNVADEVMNGDILLLPNNLYIWATMNTSDQSLFPIDSAFKRRWDWTYMPISDAHKEWTIELDEQHYDWWEFLTLINAKISSMTSSEDKKLGYFFCKAENNVISAQKFVGKVIFYLWNDVFKDYEFGDAIFNDEDGSKLSFDKFYTEEGRNSKVVAKKVALFLQNLGMQPVFIEPDTENTPDLISDFDKKMDYSKYSLNGKGSYSKGGIVYETVKCYVETHPESTADEIVNTWLNIGIKVPNLVETAVVHEQRKKEKSDSRFDQRSKMLELPSHEVIYVSNQFNVPRIEDFMEKVNAQPWNLTIAKV